MSLSFLNEGMPYPIEVPIGRSWSRVFTLTNNPANPADLTQRVPVTGYSGKAEMRRTPGDTGTALLTLAVSVNQAAVGQAGCGEITVTVLPSDTAGKTPVVGDWDCVLYQGTEKQPLVQTSRAALVYAVSVVP